MKLKNKILLSLFLIIGILFVGSLTADAKTYNKSTYDVTVPDDYVVVENGETEFSSYADNGATAFQIRVQDKEGSTIIITEEYLDYLTEIFKNDYGDDFILISKKITTKDNCIGLELKFGESTSGYIYYFSVYQFATDNYAYTLVFGSLYESYINSSEKNQIYNSFKMKDTVTSSVGIPFRDVPKTSWYYNTVKYTYENNLISGANEYEFRPDAKITRGMIVTILWRMEGSPKVTGVKDFTDVNGQYYYDAVRWAAKYGVVNGYGDGRFGPNANITREQLATILCNYAKYKGKYVKTSANTSKYKDWYRVSSYARESMNWAVSKGVITGKDNGTRVDPLGTASRAEAATMIYNYCTKIK